MTNLQTFFVFYQQTRAHPHEKETKIFGPTHKRQQQAHDTCTSHTTTNMLYACKYTFKTNSFQTNPYYIGRYIKVLCSKSSFSRLFCLGITTNVLGAPCMMFCLLHLHKRAECSRDNSSQSHSSIFIIIITNSRNYRRILRACCNFKFV